MSASIRLCELYEWFKNAAVRDRAERLQKNEPLQIGSKAFPRSPFLPSPNRKEREKC